MAGDFEILGTDQLKVFGAKLKEADKALRLKMGRNIRAATAPLKTTIPEAAQRLPKAGGLAALIGKSKVSTRITNNAQGVAVRVTTSNPHDIKQIDKGKLRHPDWPRGDDRKAWTWSEQEVEPGFWTDPVEALRGPITAAVQAALTETAKELEV